MKLIIAILLLVLTASIIKAQSKIITGSVKDVNGNPLHFVFVGNNNEDRVATFTDSIGNFSLTVNNAKGLYFSLKGYNDTSINLTNAAYLTVVLHRGVITGRQSELSAMPVQQWSGNDEVPTIASGGSIAPAHQQGSLRGNRYLFNTFVHGFVLNSSTQLVHNTNYLFDYDKVNGELLLTADNQNITLVSWDLTKSFKLFNNQDQELVFAKVPAIDQQHYVQVLSSGTKYQIYKLIKTVFHRADYVNTGVSSHGNDYDEYIDEADYYLLDVQSNQMQKIALKKKALKAAFPKDADKLNKYMSDNSGDIDDAYMTNLGEYMNK